MAIKQTKGKDNTRDIDYTPGRRVNWSNDLKIGKKRREADAGFFEVH